MTCAAGQAPLARNAGLHSNHKAKHYGVNAGALSGTYIESAGCRRGLHKSLEAKGNNLDSNLSCLAVLKDKDGERNGQ